MNRGFWSGLAGVVLAWVSGASAAQAPPPPKSESPAPQVAVRTDLGSFTIRLLPDLAPEHVRLFVKTAKAGGYDHTTFHRIIPGGIIQGGDPLSKDPTKTALYGTGGLGLLKAEFSERPMTRGSVAAVRRPSSKDSAGTQFFVCLSDQTALTGQYTIFGEVATGLDVLDRIGQTPVDGDRAKTRVEMTVTLAEP